MNDARHCADCGHYREGKPVNPLMGVRLVSKKALELRAKWQQELATRASFEEQRYAGGAAFDFEPISYPYCALFTKTEGVDPVSGKPRTVYALCRQVNPDEKCPSFVGRAE